jgi:hypothetical protein
MTYLFDTTLGPAAVTGTLTMETTDQANPGTIWVNDTDASNTDQSAVFATIESGTILGLVQLDNRSQWQQYVCVGPPTLTKGTYVTIAGAVHWNAGSPLDPGAQVEVTVTPPA